MADSPLLKTQTKCGCSTDMCGSMFVVNLVPNSLECALLSRSDLHLLDSTGLPSWHLLHQIKYGGSTVCYLLVLGFFAWKKLLALVHELTQNV